MKKIAVFGSISTDFVVETKRIAEKGETIIAESFHRYFGGKGANQALSIARSGEEVVFIGCVGADLYGDEAVENLKKEGIDTSGIVRTKEFPTGSAHITVCQGDNRILIVQGANNSSDFIEKHEIARLLEGCAFAVIQNEVNPKMNELLLNVCEEKNISVLYNPAPVTTVTNELLEKVHFLTPNEHEAKELFPEKTLEEMVLAYPEKLLITLGENGVLYAEGTNVKRIAAYKVAPVDTTGAGDTFNGYFISGIVKGYSIEKAIRFANKAASLSVQKSGAQEGVPFLGEVE
ncbi:ribokinase [Pilibacter termitis]|uniref:Ribokinase n=1 Tax=Pilibacter termitis TaxID=263852 RepID=A0A1T4LXI7_9ENTE|nr:ribokinase [Pilibacter termitis]SJZ59208.1 ribokinase [Pilibacter termitis]